MRRTSTTRRTSSTARRTRRTGTQDAPNIFRRGSIVSQLALQFKKYGFKELEVMADFSPWSKKTSRKQKLMFWGMYALLCGAMGVPALDWLDEIFGEKTGFYTKDELQKAIVHLCGGNKRLAVSLMYGIPAAFNINLSSRAGMSDVIPTSLGGPDHFQERAPRTGFARR